MFIGFKCHKCEHILYFDEMDVDADAIDRLSEIECPNCGEEGYNNWIVIGRVDFDIPLDYEE